MLRRKEDMKEWQVSAVAPTACQPAKPSKVSVKDMEEVKGVKAPEGVPTDDLIEVPKEAVEAPKPKKAPAKKKTVKKIPVE